MTMLRAALALAGLMLLLGGCANLPADAGATVAPIAPIDASALAPLAGPVAVPEAPPQLPRPRPSRAMLDPQDERADLWERVRQGYAIPDLDDELVRKWEKFYAARPDYVARITERAGMYLFHIVEEIDGRGMPLDLALLPIVESAFNPQAVSRARASGMWQFMPATGRDFELRQNVFRDDRRDVLASTRAALDYLQQLHQRFGDWHLALAAYNWGPGNVQRALARAQKAGREAAYTELTRLPAETRDYVRKLQAVKNIVQRPQAFGLALPALENHPFFLSVPIDQDIDVALVAALAGMDDERFRALNPQLNQPVILAAGTPQVLLPYDNANRFVRALQEHEGARASWTAWVAPRTLKPAEAARLVGMPEALLREVNRIPSRMLVRVGSTLMVPRNGKVTADVAEHIADNAALSLAPERRAAPAKARSKTRPAGRASVRPAARVRAASSGPRARAASRR